MYFRRHGRDLPMARPRIIDGENTKKKDIRSDIRRIRIDPLNRFSLLRHHTRQLRKDLPKLCDGRFDRFDRCTA